MLMAKREPVDFRGRDKTLVKKDPNTDNAPPIQSSGRKVYDYSRERMKYEFYKPGEQQDFRAALNAWKGKQIDANETIYNPGAALAAASSSKNHSSVMTGHPPMQGQYIAKSAPSGQQVSDKVSRAESVHSKGGNGARDGWTFTKRAPNYIPGPSTTDSREIFTNRASNQDDSLIGSDNEMTDYSGWKDYGASTSHQPYAATLQPPLEKSTSRESQHSLRHRFDQLRSSATSQAPSTYTAEVAYRMNSKPASTLQRKSQFESTHSQFANRSNEHDPIDDGYKVPVAGSYTAKAPVAGSYKAKAPVASTYTPSVTHRDTLRKGSMQDSSNRYRTSLDSDEQDDSSKHYETPSEFLLQQSDDSKYGESSISAVYKYPATSMQEDGISWDPNTRLQLDTADPSPPVEYDRGKKKARTTRQDAFATADEDMDKLVGYQPNPIRSNTSSSKSNPNVSFRSKRFSPLPLDGQVDGENEDQGIETLPHEAVLLQAKSQQEDKQKKKPSGLFAEDPSQQAIRSQTTDLSHLNFSAMNANIRRSRETVLSQQPPANKYSTQPNSSISLDGSRIVIDNTQMEKSSYIDDVKPNLVRSKSSKKSKKSDRSRSSSGLGDSLSDDSFSNDDIDMQAMKYSDLERERTTILLAKDWSGIIQVEGAGKGSSRADGRGSHVSGSKPPKFQQTSSFQGPYSATSLSNAQAFSSYQTREDVLKSLEDLDQNARHHKSKQTGKRTKIFNGSMAWLTESRSSTPSATSRNATPGSRQSDSSLYRNSGCLRNEIPLLSEHLYNTSWKEGQNMRENFYSHLRKIAQLINVMTQEIPKDIFPFQIKPTSFNGHFERRGPRSIDMYLILEHPNLNVADVQFTFDKELSAEISLPAAIEDLDMFSIRHKKDTIPKLSACKLMIVFSYIMNTTIRQMFESDPKSWDNEKARISNPKIPFPAILQFQAVSEEKVVVDMTFFENEKEVTYHVGLFLAVDVDSSFPNVLELYSRRQWPTSELKNHLEQKGVHLISKMKYPEQHTWHVTFLKTRKLLLEKIDYDGASTALLLAFQVLREKSLSHPGVEGVLIPVHFVTLLFWVHSQIPSSSSWERSQLGARFIDILIALKRCLERKECRDFFLPNLNYFAGIPLGILNRLGDTVDAVIKEPFAYA